MPVIYFDLRFQISGELNYKDWNINLEARRDNKPDKAAFFFHPYIRE